MTDWSVDLTASFANHDEEMRTTLIHLHVDGSPEPDSSSASELDDFNYLQDFQADSLMAPGDDDRLLEQASPGKCVEQPTSARQRSPLEESWVHTLNIEMDDSAASTNTTCSPDGSDAFELRDQPIDESSAGRLKISIDSCPPGPAGQCATPPTTEAAGHKRKAEVEFPPVGAARTAGMMAVPTTMGGAIPVVSMGCSVGSVVLPNPESAVRFTDAELAKLDMETARANDIVAALQARDPSTLSAEEVKLIKKHKRLIKNRESAQLSRQRKKNHLESLEVQVQQLEKERASLSARLERMAEENAFLKKQLLAQGRMPPTVGTVGTVSQHPPPAAASTTAAAAAAAGAMATKAPACVLDSVAVKSAVPVVPPIPPVQKPKAPRGSVVLAVCLFAGMFFTSVDVFQDRLPQFYTAPDTLDISRSYQAAGASPAGRGGGRVLLSTSSTDEPLGEGRSRDLDRRDLLVVTLLDHLVNQLGAHASPTLFGRLCRKLVDMKVLAGSDFLTEDGGIDAVRAQYMDEFAELNDVFVKDREDVRMDAEFTFANQKDNSKALAKSITSSPPRPPTMPIVGGYDKSWDKARDVLGLNELLRRRDAERNQVVTDGDSGKEWRMLCPDAQLLLIADKPANKDMSVAARLSRKQRSASLSPERLLNNGTSTHTDEEGGSSQRLRTEKPLSMIVPRRAISDSRFASLLPQHQSHLIEVQCKNFDLFPLLSASSELAPLA